MEFLINIDVSDLDEATRFYQSAFELRIGMIRAYSA
ncbi:VOC family protein [Trinickia caryophylli]